MHVTAYSTEI